MPVTAPPVSSASSASISGAAAWAIRRAASANCTIDMEAALVDPAAQLPQRLFCLGQRRQPIIQLALDLNVLSAIVVEPLQPFIVIEPMNLLRIFALPRPPRLGHLVHQPFAGARLCDRRARAHPRQRSAAPAIRPPPPSPWCSGGVLERDKRPAEARRQDVVLDRRSRNDRHGRRRSSSDCSQLRRIPAAPDRPGSTAAPAHHRRRKHHREPRCQVKSRSGAPRQT